MLSIIGGLAVTAAGGGALWFCLPRNGKPSPIAGIPLLDTVIPIGVVAAIAIGLSMTVAGFF